MIEDLERQRLERPKTESVIELIQYHAKAMHLQIPLYTAKAQQKAQQQAPKKSAKGTALQGKEVYKLSKEDAQAFAPLIFQQVDDYEGLTKLLLSFKLPQEDEDTTMQMQKTLAAMKAKGHLDPEDIERLTQMLHTMNGEIAPKLSPEERKQYWAQVASMYDELEKANKKIKPKSKEGKAMQHSLGSSAPEHKGAAKSKSKGNESLAEMFLEAILEQFMPKAEAKLTAIAMLLQSDNKAANMLNDLLGMINDFGAVNEFNLSTLLQNGSPVHGSKPSQSTYPDGQQVMDAWNKEKQDCQNALTELENLRKKLSSDISDIDKELKNTKDPKIIKNLKKLRGQLEKQQAAIGPTETSLKNLQSYLNGMNVTIDPVSKQATVTDPKNPPLGPDGKPYSLSDLEDQVQNGTNGVGGLQTIYNALKGYQQDYSNMSSSDQMALQLEMTDVQQMWTIVATCMTTLNQSVMTLSQSIYK